MKRIIKTLQAINGKMYVVMAGRRLLLFECSAEIELLEESVNVPVLGKGNIIKSRNVALLITFNQLPSFEVDENSLSGFDFEGDVLKSDGCYETLVFSNCLLVDDLDLTAGGQCRFKLQCTPAMINKLRMI